MKSVAEKIVEGLEKFADDLENGRPIECRTPTRDEWGEAMDLMEILKKRREQNGNNGCTGSGSGGVKPR